MKNLFIQSLVLICLSVFIISCADENCPSPSDYDYETIKICGLFSLTNNMTDLGEDSKLAMETSVQKLIEMFEDNQIDKNIIYTVEDTELNPAIALAKLKENHENGYNVFVGPSSSSELLAVQSYVNANDILVISHYSTLGTIAAKDNIFRYCMNENLECQALSLLLERNSIKYVVPIYLDDAGNAGLYSSLKKNFDKGDNKVYSATKYAVENPDYPAAVENLRTQLLEALEDANTTDEVAIYFAGFNEMNNILSLAADDNIFATVKWYCGDGITQNPIIFDDPKVAAFANTVGLVSPTMGIDEELVAGDFPVGTNSYAVALADATWNAVIASSRVYKETHSVFLNEFVEVSKSYFGYTGKTELDENGDRKFGVFDFYQVNNGSWEIYASYDNWENTWFFH